MKIINDRLILRRIASIAANADMFYEVSNYLVNCISNYEYPLIPEMRQNAINYRESLKHGKKSVPSVDWCLLYLLAASHLYRYMPNDEDTAVKFMNKIEHDLKVLDIDEYINNPYLKRIHFDDIRYGNFELAHSSIMPFELFIYDVANMNTVTGVEMPRIGCFVKEFPYPLIRQVDTECAWMSITPNEILTMKKPLENATGKVLTLGCGMGYFAYMAHLKDDVESVTIIEREHDVIDLFEKFILPQFDNPNKIKIVQADAIDYLHCINDGDYDYCFADLWINAADFEPYFAVKQVCRHYKKMHVDYWIEDALVSHLTSSMLIVMLSPGNGLKAVDDVGDDEYPHDGRIMDYLKRLHENTKIKTPDDVNKCLNPKTTLDLINKTSIIF